MPKNCKSKKHYIYILKCADKTLYTGYTTDLKRRLTEHNSKQSKTKYTRVRQPTKLAYNEQFKTKEQALKREYQIKKLTRQQKLTLINNRHVI